MKQKAAAPFRFPRQGAATVSVMELETSTREIVLEEEEVDLDGLNYLAGKTVDFINKFY